MREKNKEGKEIIYVTQKIYDAFKALGFLEMYGSKYEVQPDMKVDDKSKEFTKCVVCETEKPDVKYIENPFDEEIHCEINMEWLCDDCYHESCMDI